jgi:aspartyl-tRNA(Asn)/glutamyl-tRNA(Gln) amidotransferase subunit C
MAFDEAHLKSLARLARLALDDGQLAALGGDLTRIVAFVEQLRQVDTSGIEPMSHGESDVPPWRHDALGPMFSPETALANAPAHDGASFLVPKAVER